MIPTATPPSSWLPPAPPLAALRIFLAYEDDLAAQDARKWMSVLLGGGRGEESAGPSLVLWRLERMKPCPEAVRAEAARADLFVVAMRGAVEPAEVEGWIDEVLASQGCNRPTLLGLVTGTEAWRLFVREAGRWQLVYQDDPGAAVIAD